MDGSQLVQVLTRCNPETTLFIVASTTFTTQETLTNARSARECFLSRGGRERDFAAHFAAISSNREAVAKFGIPEARMFEIWDCVGGLYSLWSAIVLPIAIAISPLNALRTA